MSNHAFTLLAPESWKSSSSQNVSQTVSNGDKWSEVKSGFLYWHRNPGSLRVDKTSRRPQDGGPDVYQDVEQEVTSSKMGKRLMA